MQNPGNYPGGNDPSFPMNNISYFSMPNNTGYPVPMPHPIKQGRNKKKGTIRQPPPPMNPYQIPQIPQIPQMQQLPQMKPMPQAFPPSIPQTQMIQQNVVTAPHQIQQQSRQPPPPEFKPFSPQEIEALINRMFQRQIPPQSQKENEYNEKIRNVVRYTLQQSEKHVRHQYFFRSPLMPCFYEKQNDFPTVYYPPTKSEKVKNGILFDDPAYFQISRPDFYIMFNLVCATGEVPRPPLQLKINDMPKLIPYGMIDRSGPIFRLKTTLVNPPFSFKILKDGKDYDQDFFIIVRMARLLTREEIKNVIIWSNYQKPANVPQIIAKCQRCNKFSFDLDKKLDEMINSDNLFICPTCNKIIDIRNLIVDNLTPLTPEQKQEQRMKKIHPQQIIPVPQQQIQQQRPVAPPQKQNDDQQNLTMKSDMLYKMAFNDTVQTDWIGDEQNDEINQEMKNLAENDIDANTVLFDFHSTEDFVDLMNQLRQTMT